MGIFKMRARLLLSATLMAALAPVATAQDYQTQSQPAPAATEPNRAEACRNGSKAQAAAAAKKSGPALVAAPATPKARLLEKLGDWSVFIYEDARGRVCFAASAPTDMQPKTATAKRTPVVFYVTAWQKEGIRNEVSVKLGYPIKPKSAAAVTAGGHNLRCLPTTTRPTPKIHSDEQKLLAAMAGGGSMVVKATSAKGTATTDQYSLEGLAAALMKTQQACP